METLYAYLNWQSTVSLPVNALPSLGTVGVTILAFFLGATVLEYLRLGGGQPAPHA